MVIFLAMSGYEYHYETIVKSLELPFIYLYDWKYSEISKQNPLVVVTVHGISPTIHEVIKECKANNIPTLKLQDGIIEWRHNFEYPGQTYYQPPKLRTNLALFDKIAVFGPHWKRIIEYWGNPDRCIVTGCAAWDLMCPSKKQLKSPFTLLVASARTPYFNEKQRDTVLQAYKELATYLKQRKDIEVIWRVSKELSEILNVPHSLIDSLSLRELLPLVNAVITGSSTVILESMIMNLPVALLDYFCKPLFVNTAWTISNNNLIDSTINELIDPSDEKMFYQEWVRSEVAACHGEATKNVVKLIHKMSKSELDI